MVALSRVGGCGYVIDRQLSKYMYAICSLSARPRSYLIRELVWQVFDTDADFKTWFSKPFSDGADDDEEADASQEEQMVLINRLHQVRSASFADYHRHYM